jgi:hypothetical protein
MQRKNCAPEITSSHAVEEPTAAYSAPPGIIFPEEYFTGVKENAEARVYLDVARPSWQELTLNLL